LKARAAFAARAFAFQYRNVISGIVPVFLSSFVALLFEKSLTLFSKGLKAQSEKETIP